MEKMKPVMKGVMLLSLFVFIYRAAVQFPNTLADLLGIAGGGFLVGMLSPIVIATVLVVLGVADREPVTHPSQVALERSPAATTKALVLGIPAEEGLLRGAILELLLGIIPYLPLVVLAVSLVSACIHYALAKEGQVNRHRTAFCAHMLSEVVFCHMYLNGGGIWSSLFAHYGQDVLVTAKLMRKFRRQS